MSFWEYILTSQCRLGIDFGLLEGDFGDRNDDFFNPRSHLGAFGESMGGTGLPWAAWCWPRVAKPGSWLTPMDHFWTDLELFGIQKVRTRSLKTIPETD